MFNKLKQFKDLRDQAKQMKDALSAQTAQGSAEWNKVKITMNGNQEVLNVEIDSELLAADKKEKLQGAIKEATNDAVKKIQKIMAEQMKNSGFSLPEM